MKGGLSAVDPLEGVLLDAREIERADDLCRREPQHLVSRAEGEDPERRRATECGRHQRRATRVLSSNGVVEQLELMEATEEGQPEPGIESGEEAVVAAVPAERQAAGGTGVA